MDLTRYDEREGTIERLQKLHRSSAGAADTFMQLFAHSPLPAYLKTQSGELIRSTCDCGKARGLEWEWEYNGSRYVIGVVYGDRPRQAANGHAG